MNISKVNNLLDQVRVRLESLDPSNEGIERMTDEHPAALGAANTKLNHLMAKLTTGRSKSNRVRATGTAKRG